jgi:hypothetical protein
MKLEDPNSFPVLSDLAVRHDTPNLPLPHALIYTSSLVENLN